MCAEKLIRSQVSTLIKLYEPHGRELFTLPPVPQHDGVIVIQAHRGQTFAVRCGVKAKTISYSSERGSYGSLKRGNMKAGSRV